jgi:hypothetical protein
MRRIGLALRILVLRFLCATSVFFVSLWLMKSEEKHITETQRTQRLHREEPTVIGISRRVRGITSVTLIPSFHF